MPQNTACQLEYANKIMVESVSKLRQIRLFRADNVQLTGRLVGAGDGKKKKVL